MIPKTRPGIVRRVSATIPALGFLAAAGFLALAIGACNSPRQTTTSADAAAGQAMQATPDQASGASDAVTIVFLGDSITAGLNLVENQAYPAKVKELFDADGYDVDVINAGVSGDTTAGGLRRYEQLLSGTRILVVALGGNDAIRGLSVKETHDNLTGIIDGAKARGVQVIVIGMEAPTNLGEDYRASFHDIFVNLLREYRTSVTFIPFLLEGVAGNPALNQADGIHPTAEGQAIIAKNIYPKIRQAVDRTSSR